MGAYSYWRRITIDSDLVGEDDADFAFLFSSTLADLATVGNGGKIENTDAAGGASGGLTVPADLVFAAQTDGTDPHSFEVEFYDATTGELVAWVQSGVSSAVGTVVYLVYGDKEITASQEDVTGTWDGDFLAVYHLAEGATTTVEDSTGVYDASKKANTEPAQTTGKIGFGQLFDGNDYITHATLLDTMPAGLTLEMWAKPDATGRSERHILLSKSNVEGQDRLFIFADMTGSETPGNFTFDYEEHNQGYTILDSGVTWVDDTEYHVVITWDTTNGLNFLIDGVSEASDATATTLLANGTWHDFYIGDYWAHLYQLKGVADEVRVSSLGRTPDYVTTCFNTQDSPATFYAVTEPDRVRPVCPPSLPGLLIA